MPSITDQMRSRPSMEKAHSNVFFVVAHGMSWRQMRVPRLYITAPKTLQVQQQLSCLWPADLVLSEVEVLDDIREPNDIGSSVTLWALGDIGIYLRPADPALAGACSLEVLSPPSN